MVRMTNRAGLFYFVVLVLIAAAALWLHGRSITVPVVASDVLLEAQLGEPAYRSIHPDIPFDEQVSEFEIAGRTFVMPTVYIQTNLADEQKLDGINLLYVLPDFTSRGDFSNKAAYEDAFNARRFAHMLIEPSSVRPSFNEILNNRRRNLPKIERPVDAYQLKVENWYRPDRGDLVLRYRIYIEENAEGDVESFIECHMSSKFPGCSHWFRDKGLLYKTYFNMENYLGSWEELRAEAINFIDQFESMDQERNNNKEK